MPMNWSEIGASGGGGGGPVGATGSAGCTGLTGAGGGGGGAFGLNRNRFRCTGSGGGRSAFSESRCTAGAVGVPACGGRAVLGLAARLDVGAGATDVPGPSFT